MKNHKVRNALFVFTLGYLLVFGLLFSFWGDGEYIWYTSLILLSAGLLWYLLRNIEFPIFLLVGLSIAGLMHIAGRTVIVDGDILYTYRLIPIISGANPEAFILKYDQLVHFYGYAIVALVVHYLMLRFSPSAPFWVRAALAVLVASGLGAINEIVEFIAVVSFDHTYVGDFYNQSLDLVSNFAGAITAIAAVELVSWYRKKFSQKKIPL